MRTFTLLCLSFGLISAKTVPVPAEVDPNQVIFHLYTTSNNGQGVVIPYDFNDESDLTSDWDSSQNTYVIIHGWNSDVSFAERFVDDLLEYDSSCNIIGVDWGVLAPWTNYFNAAANSLEVGIFVGEFIDRLIRLTPITHSKFHVIGHSLGAQASGHVGRTVDSLSGAKLPRVTGLDPAKPWFDFQDPALRINTNDALFVDIIHTNSGDLVDGCLSFTDVMGHIDFYPAGGSHQPGCTEICAGDCTENDLIDLIKGGCSHSRSWQYFISSMNDATFDATKCSNYASYEAGLCSSEPTQSMGMPCNSSPGSGEYFLDVGEDPPYGVPINL